jgi:hypothetical protein
MFPVAHHRLREVRVQVGLTRLESATPDLQESSNDQFNVQG